MDEATFAETSANWLREEISKTGADNIAAFIAEPVQGAGGVITGWDGGNPSMGGTVLASATPALHAEAMALLQGG